MSIKTFSLGDVVFKESIERRGCWLAWEVKGYTYFGYRIRFLGCNFPFKVFGTIEEVPRLWLSSDVIGVLKHADREV